MRVWYKGLAGIRRMCSGRAPPKVAVTRSSPATRLPQEIVEIIINHLICDKGSLLACSLTCYSWYTVAAPHLHHTLSTILSPPLSRYSRMRKEQVWPHPLLYMHRLGLLPLVKKLRIRRGYFPRSYGFSPRRLNPCLLPRFFALTNIRELEIEDLNIPRFIPKARQYFKHLSPTVQSLTLRQPKGCHRQLLYFIGLFQHLEDLKLLFTPDKHFREEEADLLLIPPFTPPLRGRLTIRFIKGVGFLRDMIDLFGGIRFHHMDLYFVDRMSLLLDACAERLETLRLYLTDSRGEQHCLTGVEVLANDSTARSSLEEFGLSRNKLLRTLEVMAWSIDDPPGGGSPDSASSLLKHALSTITSPAFVEVVVLYWDYWDFRCIPISDYRSIRSMSQTEEAEEASRYHRQFEVFHEAQGVRDFQLVLCVYAWDCVGKYLVGVLEYAVAEEQEKGMLVNFSSEPIVIHSPRVTLTYELNEFCITKHIPFPWSLM